MTADPERRTSWIRGTVATAVSAIALASCTVESDDLEQTFNDYIRVLPLAVPLILLLIFLSRRNEKRKEKNKVEDAPDGHPCSASGCELQALSVGGWCQKHWQHVRLGRPAEWSEMDPEQQAKWEAEKSKSAEQQARWEAERKRAEEEKAARDAQFQEQQRQQEPSEGAQETKSNGGDAVQYFAEFIQMINERYEPHLNELKSPGTKSQVKYERPVGHARQSIIDAYKQNESGQRNDARKTLERAINQANSGANNPNPVEWPIDGVDVGRAHACMWGAIARVFTHKQSSDWTNTDTSKADAWFGVATKLFLNTGEHVMAGRALQEWGESRRMLGDTDGASRLIVTATVIFNSANEVNRGERALERVYANDPVSQESSFLLGQPPTRGEQDRLTSVLGASNAARFYNALR